MPHGERPRLSKCHYCDNIMQTDLSCNCICPHSTSSQEPICQLCITETINRLAARKRASHDGILTDKDKEQVALIEQMEIQRK